MSVNNAFVERFGIPAGWGSIRLRDLGCFIGGGTPDSGTHAYWDGDIPWLTPTEMTNIEYRLALTSERKITQKGLESARCSLLEPGTLIITTRGTVGNVVIAGEPLTCNQSCEAFVPNDNISSDYLYFLLTYWRPLIERLGAGTTFKSITRSDIRDLCFAIPQRGEQERISAILVKVDDALAAVREELKIAQCLKTALMQQLFTKGIPGRHKDFRKTKRGLMPADWQMKTISQVADVDSGVTLNQGRRPRSNGYRYLTVVNVQRDHIDLTEERCLELWPSEVPSRLLEEDDILVVEGHANRSEIGRAARVDEQTQGITFQNHLFRVRVDSDQVVPAFLLYSLNCERVRRHWNAICNTSSGLNTINRRQLRRLELPMPPRSEQEEIVVLLEASKATIRSCEGRSSALTALKKSLLQNLLTGRVRVNMEAQL